MNKSRHTWVSNVNLTLNNIINKNMNMWSQETFSTLLLLLQDTLVETSRYWKSPPPSSRGPANFEMVWHITSPEDPRETSNLDTLECPPRHTPFGAKLTHFVNRVSKCPPQSNLCESTTENVIQVVDNRAVLRQQLVTENRPSSTGVGFPFPSRHRSFVNQIHHLCLVDLRWYHWVTEKGTWTQWSEQLLRILNPKLIH